MIHTACMCLQVKEALMTSALLKLPQKLSRAKKEERVEQILEELVGSLWRSLYLSALMSPWSLCHI